MTSSLEVSVDAVANLRRLCQEDPVLVLNTLDLDEAAATAAFSPEREATTLFAKLKAFRTDALLSPTRFVQVANPPEVPFRFWAEHDGVRAAHRFANLLLAHRSRFADNDTTPTRTATSMPAYSAITQSPVVVFESFLARDVADDQVLTRFFEVVDAGKAKCEGVEVTTANGDTTVVPVVKVISIDGHVVTSAWVSWFVQNDRAVFFRPGDLASCPVDAPADGEEWALFFGGEFGARLQAFLLALPASPGTTMGNPIQMVREIVAVFRRLEDGDFSAPLAGVHVIPGVARGAILQKFLFPSNFFAFEVFAPAETSTDDLEALVMSSLQPLPGMAVDSSFCFE